MHLMHKFSRSEVQTIDKFLVVSVGSGEGGVIAVSHVVPPEKLDVCFCIWILLEVWLLYQPSCPSGGWLVCRSVRISQNGQEDKWFKEVLHIKNMGFSYSLYCLNSSLITYITITPRNKKQGINSLLMHLNNLCKIVPKAVYLRSSLLFAFEVSLHFTCEASLLKLLTCELSLLFSCEGLNLKFVTSEASLLILLPVKRRFCLPMMVRTCLPVKLCSCLLVKLRSSNCLPVKLSLLEGGQSLEDKTHVLIIHYAHLKEFYLFIIIYQAKFY